MVLNASLQDRVARLERHVEQLTAVNEALGKENAEVRRSTKRQAATISNGSRSPNFKPPGPKPVIRFFRYRKPPSADEVADPYKRLLLVEQFFCATNSLLETRPIFHQWDATIRGHVYCSFLALVPVDELERRLEARGWKYELDVNRKDLEALAEVEVSDADLWYLLLTALQGVAGKVFQAVAVAIPASVRPLPDVVPTT